MDNQIIINPAEIEDTAQTIDSLNKKINTTLTETQKQFNSTQSAWTGEAAEETRAAYDAFADRYFETYQDMLNKYVTFLRETAAQGWRQREDNIKASADNIRSLI